MTLKTFYIYTALSEGTLETLENHSILKLMNKLNKHAKDYDFSFFSQHTHLNGSDTKKNPLFLR